MLSVMYVTRTYTLTYEHTSTWLCRRQWSVLTAHISPFVVAERRLLALTSECFQTLSVSCSPREHSSVPPSPVLREHLESNFEVSKTDVYFWIAALFSAHTHAQLIALCVCVFEEVVKKGNSQSRPRSGGTSAQEAAEPREGKKKEKEKEKTFPVKFALLSLSGLERDAVSERVVTVLRHKG